MSIDAFFLLALAIGLGLIIAVVGLALLFMILVFLIKGFLWAVDVMKQGF